MADYIPTEWTKNGLVEVAETPAEAVKLRYNGWQLVGEVPWPQTPVSVHTVNGKAGRSITLLTSDLSDFDEEMAAAIRPRQTLDNLVKPFHYLHGLGSINGLPLDPAGTLAGIENAIASHPSELFMADLDARLTRDGVLVSIHDATTASVSDISVTVAQTAFRDLPTVFKPALYGSGTPRQPIASLERILSACRGRAVFSIEVKDGLSAVPAAIALTNKLDMADQIVWNSGDPVVIAALVAGGLRAFMFNCNTTTKMDQAKTAGAWMIDVPTDASTPLVDYAMSLDFAHVIRGFITTAGVAQATDAFTQIAGMDVRLSAAGTDATGYLDRPGGAAVRSASSIEGSIRTGARGPGWRFVNTGGMTDWITPGSLFLRKGSASMVYTFGDLAGAPAATQTLTIKFTPDTLPTTDTQSIRFKLFSPQENPANPSADAVEGYILGIQMNGLMFLNTTAIGGSSPSSVFNNITGTALVAGVEYTITVEIDDSVPGTRKIRITRVDTGGTSGWFTEGAKPVWRGYYHSAYSNLSTGQLRLSGFAIS